MSDPKTTVQLDLKQLRILSHPFRFEILSILQLDGAATVHELAQQMGVEELKLYYHLKKLSQVGLIKTLASRRTATKPEAVYAAGKIIRASGFDLADPGTAGEVIRNAEVILQLAAKEFRAAVTTYKNDPVFRSQNHRYLMRLSPKVREQFVEKLHELVEWASNEDGGGGERFSFTFTVTPLVGRNR